MRRSIAPPVLFLLAGAAAMAADVPREAPPLVFQAPAGRQIQLSQYKGKVVTLEFLITTCPHCQKCSQLMEKLYKEYGAMGLQPLGVAINEMPHMLVPDYIRQFQLTYPVGWANRDVAINFLQHPVMFVMQMPQLVVIDRKGVIRAQHMGSDKFFADEEKNLRALLVPLLKEGGGKKSPSSAKRAAPAKQ